MATGLAAVALCSMLAVIVVLVFSGRTFIEGLVLAPGVLALVIFVVAAVMAVHSAHRHDAPESNDAARDETDALPGAWARDCDRR